MQPSGSFSCSSSLDCAAGQSYGDPPQHVARAFWRRPVLLFLSLLLLPCLLLLHFLLLMFFLLLFIFLLLLLLLLDLLFILHLLLHLIHLLLLLCCSSFLYFSLAAHTAYQLLTRQSRPAPAKSAVNNWPNVLDQQQQQQQRQEEEEVQRVGARGVKIPKGYFKFSAGNLVCR